MSTLTKIVIVLLTLASFFLCASVVVYVGTAENYKQENAKFIAEKQAAEESGKAAVEDLNKYKEQADREQKKLNDEITALKNENSKLATQLKDAELKVSQLVERVESMGQSVQVSASTADKQTKLFEETQAKLKEVEAKLGDMDTKNKQLSDTLEDKMAFISTLEKEKKSLLEDKAELEARLNEKLLPSGRVTTATGPVTVPDKAVRIKPGDATAKETTTKDTTVRDIDLQGVIEDIDLKESIAQISIGGVDGVKVGMKFFVVRGDEFICNIEIIEVDDTRAAGKLGLIQQEPRKGDVVKTNL